MQKKKTVESADLTEVERLFLRVNAAVERNQHELAKALLGKMLEIDPDLPHAHFHLGLIAFEADDPETALPHFLKARELSPKQPEIWARIMDAYLAMGDNAGAKDLFAQARGAGLPQASLRLLAAKGRGGNKTGIVELGKIGPKDFARLVHLHDSRRFQEARQMARQLLSQDANAAPVLAVLASCEAKFKRLKASEQAYRKALEVDPLYPEAHIQFGRFLAELNRIEEAIPVLERAVELVPLSGPARKALGIALIAKKYYQQAFNHLSKARDLMPMTVDHAINLCDSALQINNRDIALQVTNEAIAAYPDNPRLLISHASALRAFDREIDAIPVIERAIEIDPAYGNAWSQLGNCFQIIGEFAKARDALQRGMERNPTNGSLFLLYVRGQKVKPGDPRVERMERELEAGNVAEVDRVDAAFGLSKAAEDLGRDRDMFRYARMANDLMLKHLPPAAIRSSLLRFDQCRDAVEMGIEPASMGVPDGQTVPIFVTGLPRSGTTLVESIIASHSKVAAGGELGLFTQACSEPLSMFAMTGKPMTGDALQLIGRDVAADYATHGEGEPFVTDKAIMSFALAGLAPHMFPGSKMIVVTRDPRDNCLSMYKNRFFDESYWYTSDLEALGEFYLEFLKTLDFWRNAHPGLITEIRYDDLVADPEAQTRALIEACNLDWEDACLDFHKTSRKVNTLSVYQVRQPISAASKGAWQRYEEDLQPLIKVLRDGGAIE